jgi:transaldolase
VSAEVIATEYDKMISEGRDRAKIAENIVVKLPCTVDGLRACKALSDEGIRTNMTLCFQPLQALMVAKAGAFLVSPFIGRIDDIGQTAWTSSSRSARSTTTTATRTKLLAASIRHPKHMLECALAGADVATVPLGVIKQLMKHPLTDIGLEKFLADYAKAFGATATA